MNARAYQFAALSMYFAVFSSFPARGQADSAPRIPLIVISNTPFKDAIRNLATQMDTNLILDPRVEGEPVTVRWENTSAKAAMDQLLKEQGFTAIYSPATSVCRIVGTNMSVKPVAADQLHGDTNTIGLIAFDDAPLTMAIANLGRQAGLQIELDPKLTEPTLNAEGKFVRPLHISTSARWKDISAAQALAALLDNYDLSATKDQSTGKLRIKPKEVSASTAPPPTTK